MPFVLTEPPEWMRRQQVEMLIKSWLGQDVEVTTEQADRIIAHLVEQMKPDAD